MSWQIVRSDTAYTLKVITTSALMTTGDYNGDLTVNAADYTVWRNALGESVTPGESADGNKNGIVDFDDYIYWKDRIGIVVPSGSAASSQSIPEPTTVGTLLMGLAGLFVSRPHRRKRGI
jgi:hypothetical protein